MADYKYKIQLIADKISYNEYNCDFYDLPLELRDEIWSKAELIYINKLCD